MGVETRLVLFVPDSARGLEAARAAFAEFARLDSLLSDYRLDSELNAINDRAGGPPVPVSAELAGLLATALELAELTGGAFDVTAGPVVALWRNARRTGNQPDSAALADAARLVGWPKLRLDTANRTARLETAGMRLDLGGIAKGYAAGAARRVLAALGIDRCLVEVGGEIAVGAAPPGSDGWTISVITANTGILRLQNTMIATSGDAAQFVVLDDRRFSHVIDLATGMGSSSGISATVIGPDGALTDGLATAVTLLDEAGRDRLVAAFPAYRFIVDVPDA